MRNRIRKCGTVVLVLLAILVAGASQVFAFEEHATTVRRADDGCTVELILQIAVDGTDADSTKVQNALNSCFGLTCTIPCTNGSASSCPVTISIVVRKKSSLSPTDLAKFHVMTMVDGGPYSYVNNPMPTPNGSSGSGALRRSDPAGIYCHEALHLCGIQDRYCSKKWDVAEEKSVPEIHCTNPADPEPCTCADATARTPRVGMPCNGYANDIMARSANPLRCLNILAVLQLDGKNSCPVDPCCPLPEKKGACRTPDGGCQDDVTQEDCESQGGEYQGDGSSCPAPPDTATGACCLPDKSCIEGVTRAECRAMGGYYQGDQSTCDDIDCSSIPTFSEWGLFILIVVVCGGIVWTVIRRRKRWATR